MSSELQRVAEEQARNTERLVEWRGRVAAAKRVKSLTRPPPRQISGESTPPLGGSSMSDATMFARELLAAGILDERQAQVLELVQSYPNRTYEELSRLMLDHYPDLGLYEAVDAPLECLPELHALGCVAFVDTDDCKVAWTASDEVPKSQLALSL